MRTLRQSCEQTLQKLRTNRIMNKRALLRYLCLFWFGLRSINSVQTRCIVKGEAQKSPLFWRFSGGFRFSQDRLLSRNSTRKPLNLIKSVIFTNTPCKSTCLYNAPSMHTVDSRCCREREAFGFRSWRVALDSCACQGLCEFVAYDDLCVQSIPLLAFLLCPAWRVVCGSWFQSQQKGPRNGCQAEKWQELPRSDRNCPKNIFAPFLSFFSLPESCRKVAEFVMTWERSRELQRDFGRHLEESLAPPRSKKSKRIMSNMSQNKIILALFGLFVPPARGGSGRLFDIFGAKILCLRERSQVLMTLFGDFWFFFSAMACDPRDLPEESKTLPAPKVKKESPESLWKSLRGSWPTPQKESKMSLRSQKTSDFWLAASPGDSLWLAFGGVGPGPSETRPETLFDYSSRGGFDSSA